MTHAATSRAPAPRITVVVPVYNAMRFLPSTAPALGAAVERHGAAELFFVDNGSTDGSAEWLDRNLTGRARVLHEHLGTISAARNAGARTGSGGVLAFVDSDCLVEPDYLCRAEEALQDASIHACGSSYLLPESPHWVERVWQETHAQHDATRVTYLPAGNFAVRRTPFEAVDGFREDLVTGEDADLGLRMTERGFVIHNTPSVSVRHLGNPRSLGGFYRKQRWHALGMFGTVRLNRIDKPVAMTLLHLVLLAVTLMLLVLRPGMGVLGLVLLAWVVPVVAVAFRLRRGATIRAGIPAALLLYQLYFLARIDALFRIVTGRRGGRA